MHTANTLGSRSTTATSKDFENLDKRSCGQILHKIKADGLFDQIERQCFIEVLLGKHYDYFSPEEVQQLTCAASNSDLFKPIWSASQRLGGVVLWVVYDTLLETKSSYPHGYIATRLELKQVYLNTGISQVIPTRVGNTQISPNGQKPVSCLTPTVTTYSSFLPLRLAPIKGPTPGHVLKGDKVPRRLVGSTPITMGSSIDGCQNNLLLQPRSQVQPSRMRNMRSSLHKQSTFQRVGFNRPSPLMSSPTKDTCANVKNGSLNSRSEYTHGQNSPVTTLSDNAGPSQVRPNGVSSTQRSSNGQGTCQVSTVEPLNFSPPRLPSPQDNMQGCVLQNDMLRNKDLSRNTSFMMGAQFQNYSDSTGMSQEVPSKQANSPSSPEQNTSEVFGVSLDSHTSDPPVKLPSTKDTERGATQEDRLQNDRAKYIHMYGRNLSTIDSSHSDATTSTHDPPPTAATVPQSTIKDKTPSDVGIKRILLHIPQWWDLAGMLGVPIDQVKAFHSETVLGGDQALAYWRDGRCGERFPTTWRFLLESVEELRGSQVAKKLREKAEQEETWSQ